VVLDGEDQNPLVRDAVHGVVRKPRDSSLSVLATKRGTGLRKLSDLLADLFYNAKETKPKALTPLLVYPSRLDHLRGRLAVEIYRLHRSASRAR
jgi:hypothetical protein